MLSLKTETFSTVPRTGGLLLSVAVFGSEAIFAEQPMVLDLIAPLCIVRRTFKEIMVWCNGGERLFFGRRHCAEVGDIHGQYSDLLKLLDLGGLRLGVRACLNRTPTLWASVSVLAVPIFTFARLSSGAELLIFGRLRGPRPDTNFRRPFLSNHSV